MRYRTIYLNSPFVEGISHKGRITINHLLTPTTHIPLHAMSFNQPMLSRMRQRRAWAMIFAHVLLAILRINGDGEGGFVCGFLPPIPPAAQRLLSSNIRPRQSTAAISESSPSWGMPPGSYHILSICTPLSVKAARRLLSLSGCLKKGVSTLSIKKKALPS